MAATLWQRLGSTFSTEIWRHRYRADHSWRGRLYAVFRVAVLTRQGLDENQAASRAAALSFSSLLALGPLIALSVLLAGFLLDKNNPALAAQSLSEILTKIAPQLQHLAASAPAAVVPGAETVKNPELVRLVEGFISSSRNGAVGTLGALSLIVIVLQLFTSVETTFNEIWGVPQGRTWQLRLVYYWTVLSLGAVLFFAALTGLSAGAVANAFDTYLPYGASVRAALQFLVPAGSLLVLVGLLTLFYRSIPNTQVRWRAALAGALVVATLLVLNNYLAFLYLKRVVLQRSLYGSLGVLPVLMFGLYVFWLFVLLGGQVSYAVQNVNTRNRLAAWHSLPASLRERLSLSVLLLVARRFHAALPAWTALQLGERLTVPTQVINECLSRLVKMELLTPIPGAASEAGDLRFQPARPLGLLSLGQFKHLDDQFGAEPTALQLAAPDPIVQRYLNAVDALTRSALFQQNLDELIAAHPQPVG